MARTANEEEKSWSERELLRALEQLRASAAESLASPTLTPNDAPLIRVALADLDAYADSLLAVLRSIDDGGGGVFDLLRPVLVAAVIIGLRRPPPFASIEAAQRIQANYAQAGKSKKAAERDAKLIPAIIAEAALQKRPLAISRRGIAFETG